MKQHPRFYILKNLFKPLPVKPD